MPRVGRSPPPASDKKKTKVSLDNSFSALDVMEAASDNDQGFVNTMSRSRLPHSAKQEGILSEFRQEIKELITSWKTDHSSLSKLVSDQTALISRLASDMAELKVQNTNIQKSNSEIEKSMIFVTKQYEDIKNQNKILHDDLKRNRVYTESLEKKIKDLQHKSRSSSIEIRNVPICDKETSTDLINIVASVGNAVQFPVSSADIRDVYRRSGRSGTTGSIIAELFTVQRKIGLLSSVRTFNRKQQKDSKLNTGHIGVIGKNQPIYVDEHLPGTVRALFYQARVFAKQNNYSYCWTSNSNIFMRKHPGDKQILVTSEATLREIQEKQ